MSLWDDNNLTELIREILSDVHYAVENHYFGRPFATPYQIAVELSIRHPEVVARIGQPIGGKDTGQYTSLSQYLAGELSRRMQSGQIRNIEGGFLSNQHLNSVSFKTTDGIIASSLTETQYDVSLYRLKNETTR
jgi:hypothetical protein